MDDAEADEYFASSMPIRAKKPCSSTALGAEYVGHLGQSLGVHMATWRLRGSRSSAATRDGSTEDCLGVHALAGGFAEIKEGPGTPHQN